MLCIEQAHTKARIIWNLKIKAQSISEVTVIKDGAMATFKPKEEFKNVIAKAITTHPCVIDDAIMMQSAIREHLSLLDNMKIPQDCLMETFRPSTKLTMTEIVMPTSLPYIGKQCHPSNCCIVC